MLGQVDYIGSKNCIHQRFLSNGTSQTRSITRMEGELAVGINFGELYSSRFLINVLTMIKV